MWHYNHVNIINITKLVVILNLMINWIILAVTWLCPKNEKSTQSKISLHGVWEEETWFLVNVTVCLKPQCALEQESENDMRNRLLWRMGHLKKRGTFKALWQEIHDFSIEPVDTGKWSRQGRSFFPPVFISVWFGQLPYSIEYWWEVNQNWFKPNFWRWAISQRADKLWIQSAVVSLWPLIWQRSIITLICLGGHA